MPRADYHHPVVARRIPCPGQPYSATVAAAGGNPGSTYTFSVAPGSTLPAGLSLNCRNRRDHAGAPAANGTFTFSIQVKDTAIGRLSAAHHGSGVHDSHSLAFDAESGRRSRGRPPLTGGTQGTPYNQSISAVGGLAPVTIALITGSVPAGLNFNNGVITGTPTGTGLSTFTVRATDSSHPPQVFNRTSTPSTSSPVQRTRVASHGSISLRIRRVANCLAEAPFTCRCSTMRTASSRRACGYVFQRHAAVFRRGFERHANAHNRCDGNRHI